MRFFDLWVILGLAVLWYGLVPVLGAFMNRQAWRSFRRRFNDLCLQPWLDYSEYTKIPPEGGEYRCIGGFESTDKQILWIKNESLTLPILLEGASTYLLPLTEEDAFSENLNPESEAPEKIRWDRISFLTEGSKVFVGGRVILQDARPVFAGDKAHPLLIIFYDGTDRSLPVRIMRAGRNKNEYWNSITPYSYIAGLFSLLLVSAVFLVRPLFQLTAMAACIALVTPLIPLIPPGLVCTLGYQRLWRKARLFRIYRDILRLPLKYGETLPGGERYGKTVSFGTPPEVLEETLPLLLPQGPAGTFHPGDKEMWYIFGRLRGESGIPEEPEDPFAPFGAVLGDPEGRAKNYTREAYILEILACLLLLAGLSLNVFFIALIIIHAPV